MSSKLYAALAVAAVAVPSVAQAERLFALTNNDPTVGQRLLTIDSDTRAVTSNVVLQTANTLSPLSDIDFRPANNVLYGFNAATQQLFTINTGTGALTPVGAALPATTGGALIDFNPTVDRIRLTGGTNNYRVNPDTGAIQNVDGQLAFAAGDANAGETPNVVGLGYTNSVAGATTTTLYDIELSNSILTTQVPPNNGTLNTVGGLGFTVGNGVFGPGSGFTSFDISGTTGVAYLTDGAFASPSTLYTVNLSTGLASSLGTISGLPLSGSGATSTVAAIAVAPVPEPTTLAALAGAAMLGLARRRSR